MENLLSLCVILHGIFVDPNNLESSVSLENCTDFWFKCLQWKFQKTQFLNANSKLALQFLMYLLLKRRILQLSRLHRENYAQIGKDRQQEEEISQQKVRDYSGNWARQLLETCADVIIISRVLDAGKETIRSLIAAIDSTGEREKGEISQEDKDVHITGRLNGVFEYVDGYMILQMLNKALNIRDDQNHSLPLSSQQAMPQWMPMIVEHFTGLCDRVAKFDRIFEALKHHQFLTSRLTARSLASILGPQSCSIDREFQILKQRLQDLYSILWSSASENSQCSASSVSETYSTASQLHSGVPSDSSRSESARQFIGLLPGMWFGLKKSEFLNIWPSQEQYTNSTLFHSTEPTTTSSAAQSMSAIVTSIHGNRAAFFRKFGYTVACKILTSLQASSGHATAGASYNHNPAYSQRFFEDAKRLIALIATEDEELAYRCNQIIQDAIHSIKWSLRTLPEFTGCFVLSKPTWPIKRRTVAASESLAHARKEVESGHDERSTESAGEGPARSDDLSTAVHTSGTETVAIETFGGGSTEADISASNLPYDDTYDEMGDQFTEWANTCPSTVTDSVEKIRCVYEEENPQRTLHFDLHLTRVAVKLTNIPVDENSGNQGISSNCEKFLDLSLLEAIILDAVLGFRECSENDKPHKTPPRNKCTVAWIANKFVLSQKIVESVITTLLNVSAIKKNPVDSSLEMNIAILEDGGKRITQNQKFENGSKVVHSGDEEELLEPLLRAVSANPSSDNLLVATTSLDEEALADEEDDERSEPKSTENPHFCLQGVILAILHTHQESGGLRPRTLFNKVKDTVKPSTIEWNEMNEALETLSSCQESVIKYVSGRYMLLDH